MAWLERRKGPEGFRFRVAWRDAGGKLKKGEWIDRRADAEQAKRNAETSLAAMVPTGIGAASLTWPEVVLKYCASRVSGKRSPAHIAKVSVTMLRLGEQYGWRDASSVTSEICLSLKPFHGRLVRAVLKFAWTILKQRIDGDALTARQAKQTSKPKILLDAALVSQLVAAAHAWSAGDGGLAHMIATYGHRAESLVGLKVSALAGDRLTLGVKSGDLHRHPLLPVTAKMLRLLTEGKGPNDPLFVGHLGAPWASGKAFSAWWGHSVAIGRPGAGVLGLRRYAISTMLALGLDAKTVATITGHRTVSLLLNTYAQSSEARQQDAMNAMQKGDVRHGASCDAPLVCATQMLPKRRHKSFTGP